MVNMYLRFQLLIGDYIHIYDSYDWSREQNLTINRSKTWLVGRMREDFNRVFDIVINL